MLEIGTQAPDFTLQNQDGEEVSLQDLRGKPVVLYFYPRADTPGCTTQACGVRDNSEAYAERDVTVLGASPDGVDAIKKFHDQQSLNFTLLADEDHAVAEQYGAWGEKSMYGKKYFGVLRNTYVIGADGKVAAVLPKVQPTQHDKLVLKALDAL